MAVRTALIYAILAGLWIVGSDQAVGVITSDPAVFERLSTYKGWFFVAVTSVLLYFGLRRAFERWEREATARQRAAVELRQSEERFRTFVDQAEDAFFLHDEEGAIVDVNRHASAHLGYSREEFLRMRVWDIAVGVAPEQAVARWKAASPGATQTVSCQHRHRDGRVIETELRITCFESKGRRLFLALARDVSERRRTEALADGERRVLEMIAVGAPLHDTLDELVRALEAQYPEMICSILLVDAKGTRLRDGASPRLPRDYVATIEGAEIGPAAGSCGTAVARRERVIVTDIATDPLWVDYRDAALRHGLVACWSTPVFGPDRTVLGTFAVYYRTPRAPTPQELQLIDRATHVAAICVNRHRAEEELMENAATLREAQHRLRSALEIGGIGTFVVDFEKDETIWDESLTLVYGCHWRKEDGANPEPFLAIVHPDDRERVRGEMRRAISGETPPPQSEYRVVHPDGSMRWVATTARAEFGPDGRPIRLIGATVDVTARRMAEENFRQVQKVEAIGQLSGGIAHDFNNILTVILAGVSFLELESGLSSSVRNFVGEIKAAATRAANLTRQLLTFSRRQAMQLRSIELNEIVTGMSRMLQRVLGEHIHMELRLAPQDLALFGDAGMVEQVIMNLSVNARDSMPGGGQLLITTYSREIEPAAPVGGVERRGRFACLEVADTGTGIAPDALPRIFEPFFTTKEAGKGTGLGLATVAGIVEQHGGWVEVDTNVGRGTRFIVHFPLVSPHEIEKIRRTGTGARRGGTETVLLVEDEAVVRALVRNLLTRAGYRVLDVASGPRALELWTESGREIDLLITDVIMPEGINGFELADRLRAERPGLRVIFTSGYSPEMVGRPGNRMDEGTTFLAKPFDLENLTATVRALLDRPESTARADTPARHGDRSRRALPDRTGAHPHR